VLLCFCGAYVGMIHPNFGPNGHFYLNDPSFLINKLKHLENPVFLLVRWDYVILSTDN
jgi:hypothetical protein